MRRGKKARTTICREREREREIARQKAREREIGAVEIEGVMIEREAPMLTPMLLLLSCGHGVHS